ncbi:MAG: AMP-binding protein, partial [Acidobacteriota bacterium]|nr:AMP-binding protein [Acidobacteriota bacterium]
MPNQNVTHRDYPRYACIHDLFELQSERRANCDAVIFCGTKCTYAELNQRSNQLAHYLRKLGVGPDVLVGLCLERSINMVVGLLGILKAGGAYVPVDPAYPKDRIAYIMSDSCAPVFVTEQKLRKALSEQQAKVVLLDTDWPSISAESAENPPRSAAPGNLAYVIYTSGSTGKPKGVQLEHRSVVNFLTSMRDTPGMTEDDTLAAVTTICFDIAGLEIYLPLITGAKVVIV